MKFCKYVLGLSSSAPRAAALGECGCLPVEIDCKIKMITYWIKLLKLNESNLSKAAYNMLLNIGEQGRNTWATKIKHMLFLYGFGYVWIVQDVGDGALFLNEFICRLKDIGVQNWMENVKENKRLQCYCSFKSALNPERYLSCIINFKIRQAFAKLRCSNHALNIETGRHSGILQQMRIVCSCKLYYAKRVTYLPELCKHYINECKFKALMQTENETLLKNLALFIYAAFNSPCFTYGCNPQKGVILINVITHGSNPML